MTAEQINPNAKRTMVFMGLLATFGSLLFGYDTGVINGALPYMARTGAGRSCRQCHLYRRRHRFVSFRPPF